MSFHLQVFDRVSLLLSLSQTNDLQYETFSLRISSLKCNLSYYFPVYEMPCRGTDPIGLEGP